MNIFRSPEFIFGDSFPFADRYDASDDFFRDRGHFSRRNMWKTNFVPDLRSVSGFLTPAQLEAAKVTFVNNFMARAAFVARYPNSLSNADFVNTLCATAGVTLSNQQALISSLDGGTLTRAQVLRQIAESSEVYNKYYNEAFVVMQYFGYLRRDPDALYLDWLKVIDANPSDSRHMIGGFVNSLEYRQRF